MHDLDSLTPREKEILGLIGQGLPSQEIANRLHRSLKTIQSHRLAIGRKLGLHNRVELARLAIRHGLAPLSSPSPAADLERVLAVSAGIEFLRALVRGLTEMLEVRAALVGELLPDHPRSVGMLAVWPQASTALERVPLAGSVLTEILSHRAWIQAEQAHRRYPQDALIQTAQAQCVAGVTLHDTARTPIGVLVLMHDQPVPDHADLLTSLSRFAPRAGLEVERIVGERLIRRIYMRLKSPTRDVPQSLLDVVRGIDGVVGQPSPFTGESAALSYPRSHTAL